MTFKTTSKFIILFTTFIYAKLVPIKELTLEGLITNPKQEISGMDWYKDKLFFLPENLGGYLFMIHKNEIQNAIKSKNPDKLIPLKTKLNTPNYSTLIPGFDGLEAIAFKGDQVYITIEAENKGLMEGYIAWGIIDPISYEINITDQNIKKIETPLQIDNMSFESIVIHNNNSLIIYEANGVNLRKDPYQFIISLNDLSSRKINAPNIEYRITDATKIEKNKFWTINYYWPGDEKKIIPGPDYIREKHSRKINTDQTIERLVEFEIKNSKIVLSKEKPINLVLEQGKSRNWEGIVRYENTGFLIATDKYPRMILAYINIK